MSGAVLVGVAMVQVGSRNDAAVAAINAELRVQTVGLRAELGERIDRTQHMLDAKVAGVVATARAEAAAAAMMAVKDYGVSVAGGMASKS